MTTAELVGDEGDAYHACFTSPSFDKVAQIFSRTQVAYEQGKFLPYYGSDIQTEARRVSIPWKKDLTINSDYAVPKSQVIALSARGEPKVSVRALEYAVPYLTTAIRTEIPQFILESWSEETQQWIEIPFTPQLGNFGEFELPLNDQDRFKLTSVWTGKSFMSKSELVFSKSKIVGSDSRFSPPTLKAYGFSPLDGGMDFYFILDAGFLFKKMSVASASAKIRKKGTNEWTDLAIKNDDAEPLRWKGTAAKIVADADYEIVVTAKDEFASERTVTLDGLRF